MHNLYGEDCEKNVDHFLRNCPAYPERRALFVEHLKNNVEKKFEHLKIAM